MTTKIVLPNKQDNMENRNLADSFNTSNDVRVKRYLGKRKYIKLLRGFMKFLSKELLDGNSVQLPSLGSLQVRGVKESVQISEEGKVKGLSPNWGKTKILWESDPKAKENKTLVYNFNEKSGGVRYSFVWDKLGIKTRNSNFYSFRAVRNNKRALCQMIENRVEYFIKNK